jgi:3-methylfumaryl-CoA hydratase
MDDFREWIGRSEERHDRLDPARSRVLRAALGEAGPLPTGGRLPALHHWLYFWDARTPDATGPDGHPKRGGFLPNIALPRRMWAGGRLRFLAPLNFGDPVHRVSAIRSIETKTGRSGALVFVKIAHQILGPQGLAIEEEQDLVYRDAGPSGGTASAPAPAADQAPDTLDSIDPDPVLLFRYSALTMNSHRIHYDQPYATGEEGYPALVVHGPLQATLLARLAARELGTDLSQFEFRGIAPALVGQRLTLHAEPAASGLDLWTAQGGRRTMSASAA